MVVEQSSIEQVAVPREGMEVRGAIGKLLGKVGSVEANASGGPVSITVQHGLFGRKSKQVPASAIKQVTDDTVVLRFTVVEFKELPNIG
jgi:sporulation protein YlmC with PRC-barrel domain